MIENKIYTKEMLEKMSTEQLVGFISYHRHSGGFWYGMDYVNFTLPENYDIPAREDYILVHRDWCGENTETTRFWANEKELREILKTRPNIPNKEQKRKARQDAAAGSRKSTKKNLKYKR